MFLPQLALRFALFRTQGGPVWRTLAIGGQHIAGALVSPLAAARSLSEDLSVIDKVNLIAVLAIADDPSSRESLIDFLCAEIAEGRTGGPMVESAAFGLFRTPLRSPNCGLEERAARLLAQLADATQDLRIRTTARLIICGVGPIPWGDKKILAL